MCDWGKSALMFLYFPNDELSGKRELKLKAVDRCIAREISDLNSRGVISLNSCCGHGKGEPDVVIFKDSVQRAKQLGFTVHWLPVGNPFIHLRENPFPNLIYNLIDEAKEVEDERCRSARPC